MDLLGLIFPKECVECGREGKYLCESCLERVKSQWLLCPYCRKPTPVGKTHEGCVRSLGLDGLICIYRYKGVVRQAIGTLKYRFTQDIAKELSQEVAKNLLGMQYLQNPSLVPIPLSSQRKRWRGFNQTEEIGKVIAQKLGWEYLPDLLVRKKSGKPQVGLSKEERLRNISGEFAVNEEVLASQSDIQGKTVVLFDDVWTSGGTIKEACKELKKSGVQKVWGLVIAS